VGGDPLDRHTPQHRPTVEAPTPVKSERRDTDMQTNGQDTQQPDFASATDNLIHRTLSLDLLPPLLPLEKQYYTYEVVKGIADFLLERTSTRPKIGIICGSGMGAIADMLTNTTLFPYEAIPSFPTSTVPGHAGRLLFGFLGQVPVMCMQGRFHYYEGYPLWKCSMPVRVMMLCGVSHLIVSNAAGGLNKDFKEGDIMIMKDHINFMGFAGNNPLLGFNDERFGPRFVAINRAYSAELRAMAKKAAKDLNMEHMVREGVYALVGGPNFETVAEVRMLRMCGADAVGMSTVHEVIVAHHAGLKVFAFSLITNKCVMDYDDDCEPNHAEVMDAGKRSEEVLKKWVYKVANMISQDSS